MARSRQRPESRKALSPSPLSSLLPVGTPSQFTHEAEGLNLVRSMLPANAPFRAWSNFEFPGRHGKWHEVDLLVLGRRRLHLVKLK
jgi:hypothetical protein